MTTKPPAASADSPSITRTAESKANSANNAAPPQSYAQRAKTDPFGLLRDLLLDGASPEDAMLIARFEPEDISFLNPIIRQTQAERRATLRAALMKAALNGKVSVLLFLARQELKAQKENAPDYFEPEPGRPRTEHEKALGYARYIGAPLPDVPEMEPHISESSAEVQDTNSQPLDPAPKLPNIHPNSAGGSMIGTALLLLCLTILAAAQAPIAHAHPVSPEISQTQLIASNVNAMHETNKIPTQKWLPPLPRLPRGEKADKKKPNSRVLSAPNCISPPGGGLRGGGEASLHCNLLNLDLFNFDSFIQIKGPRPFISARPFISTAPAKAWGVRPSLILPRKSASRFKFSQIPLFQTLRNSN